MKPSSSSLVLLDDSKDKKCKAFKDARSLLSQKNAPKFRIPPAPTAPVFSCYPSGASLSLPWYYKDVRVTMGDSEEPYEFDLAQDDGGMDAGVGIPESTLKIPDTVRWASQKTQTLAGEAITTIAVCKLTITNPPMDVHTIINGLPDGVVPAAGALIGRFMAQETVVRTYAGSYADNVDGIPAGSWKNVVAPPSSHVLLERFRASPIGKRLREEVEETSANGVKLFRAKNYPDALASFQWASVVGFFTHNAEEQYSILKNLASGWEKYMLSNGVLSLDIPLYWAHEAQKVKDTEAVQTQITRITEVMKKG